MSEINRQELLDKYLSKEMKHLKQKCFKYKHRLLLNKPITIVESDLAEDKALGKYDYIETQGEFSHEIIIDSTVIDNYLYSKSYRQYYKRIFINTIRHELVHALAHELYEGYVPIPGCNRDASPVFLVLLDWLYVTSNHKCADRFENTEIWADIFGIETFEELDKYLKKLLKEYDEAVNKTKEYFETVNTNRNIYAYDVNNNFEFSNRGFGLDGVVNFKSKSSKKLNGIKINYELQVNKFEIGSYISPWQIEGLVKKKIRSNSFKTKIEGESDYAKKYLDCVIENMKNNIA